MTIERDEALRLLLERLKADGGRYLLDVALTPEERAKEPDPTFGGKGFKRWLSDDEYHGLIDCLARAQPQGEPVAWRFRTVVADFEGDWHASIEHPSNFIRGREEETQVEPLCRCSPPAQAVPEIDRDAILAEAARLVELIGLDWKEAGMQQKQYAAEYLRDQIRALSTAPKPGEKL